MRIKQPEGFNIQSPDGSFEFYWDKSYGAKTEKKLSTVQKVIDSECIRLMKPYTPFRNGFLEQSATLGTVIGSGEINQIAPYARYLYYGMVYGPNIPIFENGLLTGFFSPPGQPKHPTGEELTYDKSRHPLAGKLWFERMKADRSSDILRAAANSIGVDAEE